MDWLGGLGCGLKSVFRGKDATYNLVEKQMQIARSLAKRVLINVARWLLYSPVTFFLLIRSEIYS